MGRCGRQVLILYFTTGATFAGSSTVLRSQPDRYLPKILTVMGRDEEAVRVVEIVD